MKSNPDCIRDILIDIEENTTINTGWRYDSLSSSRRLLDYDRFEIAYHARYCYEANLIKDFSIGGNSESIYALDLTPKGHDFLSNIRENRIWNGVKVVSKKIGSSSLDALIQISSNVVTELIRAQFGIGINSP